MLLLGAIGAIRVGRRSDGWSWAVAILVPISVYLFIGAAGRYYWGIMMMPQILACIPFATGYWNADEISETGSEKEIGPAELADPIASH